MGPENQDDVQDAFDTAFDDASGDEETRQAPPGDQSTDTDSGEADGGEDKAADESTDDTDDDSGEADGGEDKAADESADDTDDDGGEDSGGEDSGGEDKAVDQAADSQQPTKVFDDEAISAMAKAIRQAQEKETSAKDAPAEEEQPKPKTINDFMSEDDRKVVDTYEAEWAEVAKAEAIKRNAQLNLLKHEIYSELSRELAPAFASVQRLQESAHLDSVRRAHPDVDDISSGVADWIGTLPEFARNAYQEVAERGSTQEVIALLDEYKRATSKTGAVPDDPASSEKSQSQEKRPAKTPPAAAKKALAAAPSKTRSGIPKSVQNDDFDAAFEDAAEG